MARTRTTSKSRTTVEVVEATLDDLADDLLELCEQSMKRAAKKLRWPVIQTVSLERELKTMSELVLASLYTTEDSVEDYMGADYKEHTRRWTENVARAKV